MRKFFLVLAILGLAVPVAAYADGLQVPPPLGVTLGSTSIPNGGTATTVTGLSIAASGSNTLGATSLNLNGATLGTDTLGVNGTASLGNLNVTGSTVPTLGIYSNGGALGLSSAGILRFSVNLANGLNSAASCGARLGPGTSSSTVPNFIPCNTTPTTGFGGDGTNLYGIFAGVTGVTWAPTGETITASTFGASSTASGLTDNCTWNDAGTTFKGCLLISVTNTASASGSLLADFQVSGSSIFNVNRAGNIVSSGSLTTASNIVNNGGTYIFGNTSLTSIVATNNRVYQFGGADAAAPNAQMIQAQSVSAGNANTAGATLTIGGSKSNGSGCGDLVFQTTLGTAASGTQNTLATAMTLKGCTQSVVFASGISSTGTIPTVTGTGTPTIATGSTDTAGEVTSGSAATSVVITFAAPKTNAPFCAVTAQTQLVAFAYTISTTAITITQTATTGEKIDYVCFQH